MRRVVIVGAGLAGHRAAVTLRANGFAGRLTVVGDEPIRPYDRPPLSKQLLKGEFTSDQCLFPVDGLDVTWLLGRPATGLDLDGRVVELADGGHVAFDGLIIATGRRAREWPGLDGLDGVHTLRSIRDALAFRAAVSPGTRVAIVGAGFIGCEVAATLRTSGVEDVTLIDVAPYPMPALGPEAGERAARLHAARGVRLRLGTAVEAIRGTDRVEEVELAGGERVPADRVLIAVGSRPNSEWLVGSGLRLSDGAALCDEHCLAVGTDNVAVAGDIAAWPRPGGDGVVCVEHWTNARDTATLGAANLLAAAGERTPLTTVPTFWSDQYDVKIKSAGFLRAADRFVVVAEDAVRPALVVEAHREDELVGAVVFNRNRTIIDYQRKLAAGQARISAASGRSRLSRP